MRVGKWGRRAGMRYNKEKEEDGRSEKNAR